MKSNNETIKKLIDKRRIVKSVAIGRFGYCEEVSADLKTVRLKTKNGHAATSFDVGDDVEIIDNGSYVVVRNVGTRK